MLERMRKEQVPVAIDLPNPNTVVPALQSGDILVFDDLSGSKNTTARSLAEAADFQIVYLLQSSPDGQSDRAGPHP